MALNRTACMFLFLCLILPASAQIPSLFHPEIIDSLSNRLKISQGPEKVNILNGLALYLAPRYQDSSLKYANEALHLAQKLDYPKGKGVALFNIGNSYYFRMDAKNALVNYFEALRILEELEPSHELGNLYLQMAFFTDKANNCRRAIGVFKAIRNIKSEDYARMKIPTFLFDSFNSDSAYILGMQNLEYYREKNNPEGIYQSLYDLSNVCFYLYKPEGLNYGIEAMEMAEDSGDAWRIANCYHKVVNYYKNVICFSGYPTNHELAKNYLLKSLTILYNSGLPYRHRLLGETYRELGWLFSEAEEYKTAIHYSNCSLATIDTFYHIFDTILFPEPDVKFFHYYMERDDMIYTCTDLRNLYTRTGNYKKAYEYWNRADSVKESWKMNMTDTQIITMQANYEDQKKRQQIAMLKQENEIQRLKQIQAIILSASIGGTLLIALLSAIVWIQQKRFRSDRKALILEQKLLRSQMNLHFIFNSLASIQNFILNQQADNASIFLTRFSKLLRNVLDNSTQEYVPLEKEISTIENYLALQKIRFGNKFEYTVDVDEILDPESVMIPPMLAQPFIENSIEHGIKHKNKMGHIHVRFKQVDHMIHFEVEDDGVGREKAREVEIQQQKDHRSMATSITRERLENLNKKLKYKISLKIIDLHNTLGEATGTKVVFGIPIASQ